MSKHMMKRTYDDEFRLHAGMHGHQYMCRVIATRDIVVCDKLPPILKALREDTGHTFKIPHGNKVRTLIIEEGMCIIYNDNGKALYEITIKRW